MSTLTQLYGPKSFVVVSRHELQDVFAASGLAETPEGWLVVCDDVPEMFLLDNAGNLLDSYAISAPPPVLVEGRVPKKHKRDFEAIADWRQGKETKMLVVGSGSKFPQRTFMVQISWLDGLKSAAEVQAEKFYQQLVDVAGISPDQLNIEGAAVFDNRLVFLNRGMNQTMATDLKGFLKYLDGGLKESAPLVSVHRYELPQINGIQTGFSGACTDLRRNRIYFSATAEDTPDWIQDGEVLGSFIGWIVRPLAADGGELHVHPVVGDDGEFLPVKIEAIGLLPMVDSKVRMLAMTDSDGGRSEMLVLVLELR